ncbi:MAG: hypothetical protein AAGK78_02290 [Planctomycetota bacterium]
MSDDAQAAKRSEEAVPSGGTIMDPGLRRRLRPGARVRVVQQIAARNYAWGTEHVGLVVKYEQKQTGSWYAHSRGDKLWLDRLVMKKDDGEVFTFNLDEYTNIDVVTDAPDETPEDLEADQNAANLTA